MRDKSKEKIEACLESALSPLHRHDGGSSSSLDSKDSKNGKQVVPTHIDEKEKAWFRSSSKCDLEQLKKLYEINNELINKKDYFTGFAAVHWAAKKGRCDVISWLYEKKADTNIRNNGGYTPLHIATMHKNEVVIQRLVNSFSADINVRDYSGKKARHYLTNDLSASVTRVLQETPSVIELIVDPNAELVSTDGFLTPTIIRKQRKPLAKLPTIDIDDEHNSFRRIKKKGLSISNSFKMKKRSHFVMKRPTINGEQSPASTPKWERSPSVPDIVLLAEVDTRRQSVVDYAAYMTIDQANQDTNLLMVPTRKHSVSDMLINGYAGLINDNKHHRKQSTTENKEWGINTWI